MCLLYSKPVKELATKVNYIDLKNQILAIGNQIKFMEFYGNKHEIPLLQKKYKNIQKALTYQTTQSFRRHLKKIRKS